MNSILCRKALTGKVRAFFILLAVMGCQSSPLNLSKIESKRNLQSDEGTKNNPIIVSFLGDVIIHERLRKREESSNEGYQTIWAGLQKYLNKSDINYANLEGPVAEEIGGVSGFPLFNFPNEIIPTLKSNKFDIVSTANNHALDRKAEGIKKTIEKLNRHGVKHSGTVAVAENVSRDHETWWGLTEIKNTNLKLAWLACAEMTNGNYDKEEQVLYCYKHQEKIKELIQELNSMPEIAGIILTPHWGEEEKFTIESRRRSWAQQMIELGASAVVGSHPHVVQKIENYQTQDGRKTFIAYSMGNFVSNQPWTPNKTSMMLFAKFKLNETQRLDLVDLKYISLWMTRTIESDSTAKYRIRPVWDLSKAAPDAVTIWKNELTLERRFNSESEADLFFSKE